MEERRSCRICASERFEARYEKNGFKIDRCVECSLVQVRNSPGGDVLQACYDQAFFDKTYGTLQHDAGRQGYEVQKFNYRWDEIEKRTKGKGKILDIGCSFGYFLDAARQRGWNCCGLEISEFAADYARRHFFLTVINKPLEEAEFEPESFDVVTLWNVIEHLEDPVGAVRRIHSILRPGGMLVLTTGNIESPLARLQGRHWRMLIPPVHLCHFSPGTIRYLLEAGNLEIVEQTCALPYEFLLTKIKLIGIFKALHMSDKMLIYARRRRPGSL